MTAARRLARGIIGEEYEEVVALVAEERPMRPARTLHSTITRKGQVTIPVEIRRLLRVAPHDRVTFVVEGDQVRLVRGESMVARTAGAAKSHEPPLTAEELREAAERAIAEEAVERMGG